MLPPTIMQDSPDVALAILSGKEMKRCLVKDDGIPCMHWARLTEGNALYYCRCHARPWMTGTQIMLNPDLDGSEYNCDGSRINRNAPTGSRMIK